MSASGPTATIASLIRDFHRTRSRLVAVWLDPVCLGDATWRAHERACDALRAALRARGGRWEVDGLIYELDRRDGIELVQAPSLTLGE